MKMNEHQKRLWQEMIDLIQSYLDGQNEDFNNIVGKLEGALDAAEIKDDVLVNEWYDYWTPLEIRRAVDGDQINKNRAREELNAMKVFLQNFKQDNG